VAGSQPRAATQFFLPLSFLADRLALVWCLTLALIHEAARGTSPRPTRRSPRRALDGGQTWIHGRVVFCPISD
jgi:hypothetical protein